MNTVLVLPKIAVQNANAVAGLTWGFPAVTHFLGLVHALERRLGHIPGNAPWFTGCAIICHSHQHHTRQDPFGEHKFSISRQPAWQKKHVKGRSFVVPFNEEGRMHLTVSLLVSMGESPSDCLDALNLDESEFSDDDNQNFASVVAAAMPSMRLAGGTLVSHGAPRCITLPADPDQATRVQRRTLMQCLPGFALVHRPDILTAQHSTLTAHTPAATLIDAWIETATLRTRASQPDPDNTAEWHPVERPAPGWFVPLMVGYQGIAPLQPAGSVASARDADTPICPVESVYSVGQWISPHRVKTIDSLLWHYHSAPPHYRVTNPFTESEKGAL